MSEQDSLSDLKELVRLSKLATPGPWIPCLGSGDHLMTGIHSDARNALVADFCPPYFLDNPECLPREEEWKNIQFTVAARNSIPSLEALLSRHEKLVAAAQAVHALFIGMETEQVPVQVYALHDILKDIEGGPTA